MLYGFKSENVQKPLENHRFLTVVAVILGRLEAVLGRLGTVLGRLGAILGRLGAMLGAFSLLLGQSWTIWGAKKSMVGHLCSQMRL